MARIPTPTIQLNERIEPKASPVDSYVRVAEAPRSPLWDLAAGLQRFDSGLQSFLDETRQERDKAAAVKGETDFYKNNRKGYAKGVRDGTIPAYASKPYRESYKKAEGSFLGQRLKGDLAVAYETWDGKNSTDPASFDDWFSKYVSTNLTEEDPEVLAGVLPQLREVAEGLHNQHLDNVAKKVYWDGVKAHVASATVKLDNADEQGVESGQGVSYDEIWSDIIAQREEAISSGARADDFDKELVDMIASKAIEHRDPNIMKLLDRALPGKKYAIKDDPQFRAKRQETEEQLISIAVREESEAGERQRRADVKRLNELTGGAITQIFEDPNAVIPEAVLQEGSKLDGDFRVKILNARKAVTESSGLEDPRVVAEIYRQVAQGGGTKAVMEAMNKGLLKGSFKEAYNFAKALEDDGGKGGKILNDPAAKRISQAIFNRTAKDSTFNFFDPNGWSDDGLAAQNDFDRQVVAWGLANPNAGPLEQAKAINEIGKSVLDSINTDERTYESPTGQTADNPFGTKKKEEPAAAPEEPAPGEEQPLGKDPARLRNDYQDGEMPPEEDPERHGSLELQDGEARPLIAPAAEILDHTTIPDDLPEAIATVAEHYGIPHEWMEAIGLVESGLNPNVGKSSTGATGPWQFTKGTARDYGLKNRNDVSESTNAAARKMANDKAYLTEKLGREPTLGEVYLAYQQGPGGAAALLANPDGNAVDVLATVFTKAKDPRAAARQAVLVNGGNTKMSAGQFAEMWSTRIAKKSGVTSQGPGVPAPSIDLLTPTTREYVENIAKQRAIDPEVLMKRAWARLKASEAERVRNDHFKAKAE